MGANNSAQHRAHSPIVTGGAHTQSIVQHQDIIVQQIASLPIPKTPNYAVPENRVLPAELSGLPDQRKFLRPVSRELSLSHPDFAEIFKPSDDTGRDIIGGSGIRAGVMQGNHIANRIEKKFSGDMKTNLAGNVDNGMPGHGHKRGMSEVGIKSTYVDLSRSNSMQERASSNGFIANGGPPTAGFVSSDPTTDGSVKSSNIESVKSSSIDLSRSNSMNEKTSSNGFIPNGVTSAVGFLSSDPSDVNGGLHRTESLGRHPAISQGKVRAHKRFSSTTSNLTNEDAVIPEDPREHLYTAWRKDPFSNTLPSTTSLPQKSSFDLDYSFNLTYAQLAEFRRQKRMAELEERTGKRLSELSAELAEQNSLPVSPFDRSKYRSSGSSAPSTTSSDTDASKSKKRRAPLPPNGESRSSLQDRDSSPGRLSVNGDLLTDYDYDSSTTSSGKASLKRQDSITSKTSSSSKGPAPKPFLPASSSSSLMATPPFKNTQQSVITPVTPAFASLSTSSDELNSFIGKEISHVNSDMEALKSLQKPSEETILSIVKSEEVVGGKHEEPVTEKKADLVQDTCEECGENIKESLTFSVSDSEDKQQVSQTINPILQQNIMAHSLTTEAVGKIPPLVFDKPKPAHILFKEELAKAAIARDMKFMHTEKQNSNEGSEMDQTVKNKENVIFNSELAQVRRNNASKESQILFKEELAKAAIAHDIKFMHNERQNNNEGSEMDQTVKDKENVIFNTDLVQVKRSNASKENQIAEIKESKLINHQETFADTKHQQGSVDSTHHQVSIDAKHYQASIDAKYQPKSVDRNPAATRALSSISKTGLDVTLAPPDKTHSQLAQQKSEKTDEHQDNSKPVSKIVSGNGVFELSDEEREYVQMRRQVDKSPTLSSVFSDDWKPQDDLDTDDDMADITDDVTYSRNSASLDSSDGFKSSLIPDKIDDLKLGRKSSLANQSKRRESGSSVDEATTYNSIRRFRNSIHEGMKNAFGSIREAPGKLIRRPRSHNYSTKEVEAMSYKLTHNGIGSSLTSNGYYTPDDDSTKELERDVTYGPFSPISQDKQEIEFRKMKRAGVAYVSNKGQIVLLPDFETVKLDADGNVVDEKRDEGHAPRIFRKKKKKFTYESTVRVHQKDLVAERIAQDIREKERQMELERRQQQDLEKQFQKLRDIETQERVYRMQTAHLEHQANLMQQHRQRQQVSSTLPPPPSPQFVQVDNHPHPSLPNFSSQVENHPHPSLSNFSSQTSSSYPTSGGLSTMERPQVSPVHVPSYSTSLPAQPLQSVPIMSTAVSPTMAGYDINYLTNYMQMLGVQPPTTQQQWSLLLSNVSNLSNPGNGISPTGVLNSSSKGQNLIGRTTGPDLTSLFPTNNFTPPYTDMSGLLTYEPPVTSLYPATYVPQSMPFAANNFAMPSSSAMMLGQFPSTEVQTHSNGHYAAHSNGHYSSHSNGPKSKDVVFDVDILTDRSERKNPVYYSSDDDSEREQPTNQISQINPPTNRRPRPGSGSKEGPDKTSLHRTSVMVVKSGFGHPAVYRDVTSRDEPHVTRVQVPDYGGVIGVGDSLDDSDSNESSTRDNDKRVVREINNNRSANIVTVSNRNGNTGKSTSGSLPANVYGPMGYRPIKFSVPATRTSVPNGDVTER